MLNNENILDTGRGASHCGLLGGTRGRMLDGSWGGITWGEMPNIGDGGMEAAKHHGCIPM